jgi:hypothetical protein
MLSKSGVSISRAAGQGRRSQWQSLRLLATMASSNSQINAASMAHMLDHDNHETRKGLKEVQI